MLILKKGHQPGVYVPLRALFLVFSHTPHSLYNTVSYNTVLDITRISVGPQLVILDLFSFITKYFTLFIARFG